MRRLALFVEIAILLDVNVVEPDVFDAVVVDAVVVGVVVVKVSTDSPTNGRLDWVGALIFVVVVVVVVVAGGDDDVFRERFSG